LQPTPFDKRPKVPEVPQQGHLLKSLWFSSNHWLALYQTHVYEALYCGHCLKSHDSSVPTTGIRSAL
jgi:hypothetical protein